MYAIEHRNISLVETILGAVDHSKVRNVVKTQAFDGSSCLKIAEGIKRDFNDFEFNRLWDILQGAISGNVSRIQPQVFWKQAYWRTLIKQVWMPVWAV